MKADEQGFTLVELIVGMAILTLIMSGTYGILATSVKSYQYNFEQGKNIQDSRQIFNEITKGIKNATAITITAPTPNPKDTSILSYSITDTSTSVTDTYVVSLDTDTSAIMIQKNGTIQTVGTGRVDKIKVTSTNRGSKKEINIQLFFKNSDPTKPTQTTVTTLNDLP